MSHVSYIIVREKVGHLKIMCVGAVSALPMCIIVKCVLVYSLGCPEVLRRVITNLIYYNIIYMYVCYETSDWLILHFAKLYI